MAAAALLAYADPSADPHLRHQGALLVFAAFDDLFLIRSYFLERPGE